MVDIGIAGDDDDVAAIPAKRFHFGARHRQERRRRLRFPVLRVREDRFDVVHGGPEGGRLAINAGLHARSLRKARRSTPREFPGNYTLHAEGANSFSQSGERETDQKSGAFAVGSGLTSWPEKKALGLSAQISSCIGPSAMLASCAIFSAPTLRTAASYCRKRWMPFQGMVKAPGSSTRTLASISLPPSVRRKRSTTCSALLCGVPNPSTHVLSLIPTVSTTSVSPS